MASGNTEFCASEFNYYVDVGVESFIELGYISLTCPRRFGKTRFLLAILKELEARGLCIVSIYR